VNCLVISCPEILHSLWGPHTVYRPLLINRLQRYDLSKKIDPAFFERGLNTERRDLTTPFTNHYDALSRMTSDNKIYGYDSMPYATRMTTYEKSSSSRIRDCLHNACSMFSSP